MKKILIFISGIVAGVIVGYILKDEVYVNNTYVKLKNDYCVEDVGFLEKGTLLKFDQAYSEGFSRYILYLNLQSVNSSFTDNYDTNHKNEIIPYWLKIRDSTCLIIQR